MSVSLVLLICLGLNFEENSTCWGPFGLVCDRSAIGPLSGRIVRKTTNLDNYIIGYFCDELQAFILNLFFKISYFILHRPTLLFIVYIGYQ